MIDWLVQVGCEFWNNPLNYTMNGSGFNRNIGSISTSFKPSSCPQLQRGSLGAIGKKADNRHAAPSTKEPREEGIDRYYGGGEYVSSSRQARRRRSRGGDYHSESVIATRGPFFVMAIIIIIIGIIKIGGCALENVLDSLKLQNESPRQQFQNPHYW